MYSTFYHNPLDIFDDDSTNDNNVQSLSLRLVHLLAPLGASTLPLRVRMSIVTAILMHLTDQMLHHTGSTATLSNLSILHTALSVLCNRLVTMASLIDDATT